MEEPRIPPGPLFLPWDVSEWVIVFGHVVSDGLLRTRRQDLVLDDGVSQASRAALCPRPVRRSAECRTAVCIECRKRFLEGLLLGSAHRLQLHAFP